MNDIKYLILQNELTPTDPPPESICGWIEAKRILPPNTPFPGPYRFSRTPYQREIVECMGPYSPVNNIAVLKSRKVGLTTAMEGAAAFWCFAWPADIIYSTATEALAKQWATETFMHVIQSMGFQDRLIPAFSTGRNKRSAVTAKKIEYLGGHLDIISSGSLDARRQKNARIIILDEVDGLPEMTTTGEGSYIDILRGHQMSWGARRKFCAFSSPTTYETSAIWKLYNEGDCRKFFMPCPVCGKYIELRDTDEAKSGLKAETKGGKIIDVYYICEYCGEAIFNNDKMMMYSDNPRCRKHPEKMLAPAHWQPTREISDPYSRSYSTNSLYAPIGAVTFRDVYEAKKKAEAEGPDAMRSFTNLHLGLPYRDTAAWIKADTILNLRMEYKSWEIPAPVLFLTMAIDVQRGSEKDENNPPRLELEVMGVCKDRISYSIGYKVFYGDTDNPFSGAWAGLDQWINETTLTFTRVDGQKLAVLIVGIDSGDAYEGRAETVYRYCERYVNFFPLKGFYNITANRKNEKGDLPGGFKRYRAARIGGTDGGLILEVNTAHYKNQIFSRLKIPREPERQKYGFCGFPSDYPDSYFQSLTAEEKRTNGSWHKVHGRNEALDVRVYNLALEDFFLDSQTTAWKSYWQHRGVNALQLSQITPAYVLDTFIKNSNGHFPIGYK